MKLNVKRNVMMLAIGLPLLGTAAADEVKVVKAKKIMQQITPKTKNGNKQAPPIRRGGFKIASNWVKEKETANKANKQAKTGKKKPTVVAPIQQKKIESPENTVPNAVKVKEAIANTMFLELKKPKKEHKEEVKQAVVKAKMIEVYTASKFSFPVQFKLDSYEIQRGTATKQLNEVAKALKLKSEAKFLLEGHTCDLGEEIYNNWLSAARAVSVRNYLVKRGVSPEQLICRGFGESEPEFKIDKSFGKRAIYLMRAKNRKVVLRMLK